VSVALEVTELLRRVFEFAGLDFVGADLLRSNFETVFLLDARHVGEATNGGLVASAATFELEVDAVEGSVFFAQVGATVAGVPTVAEVVVLIDVHDFEAQRIFLGRAKEGEQEKQSCEFHADKCTITQIVASLKKLVAHVVEVENHAAGGEAVDAEEVPLAAFEP